MDENQDEISIKTFGLPILHIKTHIIERIKSSETCLAQNEDGG
jgi:hypothetical protein